MRESSSKLAEGVLRPDGRFFMDFGIEILFRLAATFAAAPPKPHLGCAAGGAGSLNALGTQDCVHYRSKCSGTPVLSG